jgi:hypothetical protein
MQMQHVEMERGFEGQEQWAGSVAEAVIWRSANAQETPKEVRRARTECGVRS